MTDPGQTDNANAKSEAKKKFADHANTKQEDGNDAPPLDDKWPLEASRIALQHPLITCLKIVAGHYGRRTTEGALTAGLPLSKSNVTPTLFVRAAERADMESTLVEKSLEAIAITPNMPCILVLEEGQACIVWNVEVRKDKIDKSNTSLAQSARFSVIFPESGTEIQKISFQKLQRLYTGYAYYLRPIARVDDRAGPAEIDNTKDWFKGAIFRNKKLYKEVALAAVFINLLALASPLFIMNVYDRVIPNNAQETLWVLTAGVLVAFIFDFILKNLRAHFLDHAGKRADNMISASLFEQLMGMKMSARPDSAGVMASHMREFETLRDFFTSATLVTLIDLPFAILFILLIGVIGGPVAIVPACAVPIIIVMGFLMQKPLEKITKESMRESALKNAHLFEAITGLETVKIQASEGHTQRKWEELTDKASGTAVKARRVSAFAQNFTAFIQQVSSILIIVVGFYLIQENWITMGALIACVILNGRVMAPLAQISGLLSRLNQSRQALRQLDEMMKKPVERTVGKHFIPLSHVEGEVEFREVTFRYPSQTIPALSNLNFIIPPGEKVGVIGAVGSGKTTLARLMLNLYEPESGSVQLDGTDVRQIDPGDLRRHIGVVQQGAQLFYGSVRENITMGHETAPDRAVIRAAELAGVMEFLRDSEAGLDTQVGERGEALSGGQRQSVAIARALLYDPPVMIMDEPTAAMDPASENRLKKRLLNLTDNRTVILITHKGGMLQVVDKIILMDRGKLVAYGPKEEIISKLRARQYGTAAEDD